MGARCRGGRGRELCWHSGQVDFDKTLEASKVKVSPKVIEFIFGEVSAILDQRPGERSVLLFTCFKFTLAKLSLSFWHSKSSYNS